MGFYFSSKFVIREVGMGEIGGTHACTFTLRIIPFSIVYINTHMFTKNSKTVYIEFCLSLQNLHNNLAKENVTVLSRSTSMYLFICPRCFIRRLPFFYTRVSSTTSYSPLMQLFEMWSLSTESFWLNFDNNFASFRYAPTYFIFWFQGCFSSVLN